MHFVSLLRASLVVIIVASIVCSSDAASPYVNTATIFGGCANFSIQAGTAVSFNGVQTNVSTGNVGVAPNPNLTGTPVLGTGTIEACTGAAHKCLADAATAYSYLNGLTCTNTLASSDLAGLTLYPGIYCIGSGYLTLTTTNLYLDAQGDANAQFIFKTATTVITSTSTKIILQNGALVKNVFWLVGTSVTLGGYSQFMGQVFAQVAISVNVAVIVVGRLYAAAGVSFAGTDLISLPAQY